MHGDRVDRAIEIATGWLARAGDDQAALDVAHVLDVLRSIRPTPATRCAVGPEQCCCRVCWPDGPAA